MGGKLFSCAIPCAIGSANALVAQLVEHLICNQGVACSNHVGGTTQFTNHSKGLAVIANYRKLLPFKLGGNIGAIQSPWRFLVEIDEPSPGFRSQLESALGTINSTQYSFLCGVRRDARNFQPRQTKREVLHVLRNIEIKSQEGQIAAFQARRGRPRKVQAIPSRVEYQVYDESVQAAINTVKSEPKSSKTDWQRHQVIIGLCVLWDRQFKNSPGRMLAVSQNVPRRNSIVETDVVFSGAFFLVVKAILHEVGRTDTDAEIASAIKRVRASWTS